MSSILLKVSRHDFECFLSFSDKVSFLLGFFFFQPRALLVGYQNDASLELGELNRMNVSSCHVGDFLFFIHEFLFHVSMSLIVYLFIYISFY